MIVTFAGYKGGVAKTTSAIHLACYLHRIGHKTLLVDSDPNRSALDWNKRGGLPVDVVNEKQLVRCIGQYEHTIIDTQARPSEDDLRELVEVCDLLVLPTTPERMALEALVHTVNRLHALDFERFKILLTQIPPPPEKDGTEARAALEEMGLPIFASGIRYLKVFKKASEEGIPVYDVKDKNRGRAWTDYESLGKELVGSWASSQA